MDDIGILEELGLEEVSRKTHIETKYLEHMVNREFNKLNRINTLGFVKILRREYNLDLQEWVDEFEAYLEKNTKETVQADPVLQQDMQPVKSRGWIYLLLLLLVLLGVAFWYFNGMQYVNQLKESLNEKNTSTFTQAPIINEAKEKLDALEEDTTPPVETVEIISTKSNTEENESNIQESVESISPSGDADKKSNSLIVLDSKEQELIDSTMDENITLEEVADVEIVNIKSVKDEEEQDSSQETQEEMKQEEKRKALKEITIKPNKKIWIGAINLKTKKRKTRLSNDDIKLDVQDPHILIVGHGSFIFDLGGGENQKPDSKQKSYYHIENGKVKYISKEEFIKINGGKSW